ncbi:MAG TPA: hypothetical protein PKC39_01315 [Ferruginibacter sp.]|nr:hypothetical protein [Ferruginibacter sp.]HMP19572.1 hypothetical protein [Ferruginibacter sp.]
METLVLQTRDKKESVLLKELLKKMNISVMALSKEEQEDFVFGKLIKAAVKQGEAKPSSIAKIINKWK